MVRFDIRLQNWGFYGDFRGGTKMKRNNYMETILKQEKLSLYYMNSPI